MSATSALLALADGRLPSGGHAHSGGLEEAVAAGRVDCGEDLACYLAGRLATTGRVDACVAVASRRAGPQDRMAVEREAAARCPSPALRAASRAQGRGMLRVGGRMWPHSGLVHLHRGFPAGLMWPVALGAVAAVVGLDDHDVALVAAHAAVGAPAWAATRLLGLDPFVVARCIADLSPAIDVVAGEAPSTVDAGPSAWPAGTAPLTDIGAEHHAAWEVRLFAS